MNNPYFTTFLYDEICVAPGELNSNIRANIKQKTIRKHKGKCFKQYGYVMDVYSIQDELEDGEMRPEDPSSSVYYKIQFKAKICYPLIGTVIVALVDNINMHISICKTGPLIIIIDKENMNKDKFRYNNTRNALYPLDSKGKELDDPVVAKKYVKVRILEKRIVNGDNKIITMGYLEDMATKEEVKQAITNSASYDEDIVDIDELLKKEEEDKEKQTVEDQMEENESAKHEAELSSEDSVNVSLEEDSDDESVSLEVESEDEVSESEESD